jgi:flagellar biogenesis protein FliO
MLSAVIVVLGLLALTAFGMRKLMPRIARATGKEMAVQESLPLGQGRMLHLVNVGGRKLLISSTKERVTMLADLSGTGVGPVGSSASCGRGQAEETHGQDARATENHGRDAHATHGQDGRATEDSE